MRKEHARDRLLLGILLVKASFLALNNFKLMFLFSLSYRVARNEGLSGVVRRIESYAFKVGLANVIQNQRNHETFVRSPTEASSYLDWLELNGSLLKIQGSVPYLGDSNAKPRISVITPTYNPIPKFLKEMCDSVACQTCTDWEHIIVDDGSTDLRTIEGIIGHHSKDPRVRLFETDSNRGISAATNEAVDHARGEFLLFLDHDDVLTPDCLSEILCAYEANPDWHMVYSDHDKIDENNMHFAPQFKPDWSPILLLSSMYIGHALSCQREAFLELGGFNSRADGAQDYDFVLRAAGADLKIGHISKILYSWRASKDSLAKSAKSKPGSISASIEALSNHLLESVGSNRLVEHPKWAQLESVGYFKISFPAKQEKITWIIVIDNDVSQLTKLARSAEICGVREVTTHFWVNETLSQAPEFLALQSRLASANSIFLFEGEWTDYHTIAAILQTETKQFFIQTNRYCAITHNWLSDLAGLAGMRNVGIVGPKIISGNKKIITAGGYYTPTGGMYHAFRGLSNSDRGYSSFGAIDREVSFISALCFLSSKKLFSEFASQFKPDFNVTRLPVEFCLSVSAFEMEPKGATISANSVEFETDGDEDSGSSSNRVLRSRVFEQFSLSSDPYYNPNFDQGPQQFNIGYNVSSVSEQSRLKIGFVSHNLEREGSPKYLLDLVEGLGEAKNIGAVIYAAANGPLFRDFEAANLPVKIFEAPKNFRRVEGFLKEVDSLAEMFNRDNLDLLVCNTLQSFWAVLAANRAKIPCVLVQHESDSPDTYFRFLPKKLRRMAEGIFSLVFRAVYVSEATREVWRPFHTKNNTVVIEQAVRREKILKTFDSLTKQQARKKLDVGVEEIMVVCIGTISRRKNQKDLIEALEVLEADRTKMLKIFLVGKFGEEDYVEDIKRRINTLPKSLASRILLTGNVEDVAIYLRAADIYVCTSIIESAPRTIVEAMGAFLPVISTPVFGIVEMVEENRNCLFYQPGNIHQLAKLIAMLSSDKYMRKRLSEHSQTVFNTFTRFDWMIGHWSDLIQMAVASKSRQNKRAIVRHE